MPDVLNQKEVDALLEAMGGDEETLMDEKSEAPPLTGEVTLYDFKRPERVSKDQMRTFETIHEVFARNLGASLSGTIRHIIEVRLLSVEQLTYSEFIMSLPNPTCFYLLGCPPLEGEMVLEINPTIIFPVIDRMLGGKAHGNVPDRSLTEIEYRLVDSLLDKALVQLRETWNQILEIDFSVRERESNPLLMQIAAPNAPVVLVCFEVAMGDSTGMMNLCIPVTVVEPIMGEFATHTWYIHTHKKPVTADVKRSLQRTVGPADLQVQAFIAESSITVRDLLELKIGDIIVTEKQSGAEALLCVENLPKFRGLAGSYNGKRAFRITRVSEDEEVI
ncbi:MAG: flagellar motor switch protein FliM [Planctomycetota bacterium]|nr:MAG: flagellar motor switch protein FliM [Planctomycetota bacterium]